MKPRTLSPPVVEAVARCLMPGADQAVTGAVIARHLRELGLPAHLRRVGEAVEELRRQGLPIASDSRRGYWLASSPADLDNAIAESRRRALAILASHRHLRRARAALTGQLALGGIA